MSKTAIRAAVKKAGGAPALAAAIGAPPHLVHYWCQRAQKGASPKYVLKIEAATGISRHDLRRDIYPREDAA